MPDVHDVETRRRNMAAIRRRDTKPEMQVRRGLHALGYRYRLDVGGLPGRPDIVLPKHRAVIFVNGCFWHVHHCSLFKWPKSRVEFWRDKISGNIERDKRAVAALLKLGWRVGTIWECSLKGGNRLTQEEVIEATSEWLRSGDIRFELGEVSPHHTL